MRNDTKNEIEITIDEDGRRRRESRVATRLSTNPSPPDHESNRLLGTPLLHPVSMIPRSSPLRTRQPDRRPQRCTHMHPKPILVYRFFFSPDAVRNGRARDVRERLQGRLSVPKQVAGGARGGQNRVAAMSLATVRLSRRDVSAFELSHRAGEPVAEEDPAPADAEGHESLSEEEDENKMPTKLALCIGAIQIFMSYFSFSVSSLPRTATRGLQPSRRVPERGNPRGKYISLSYAPHIAEPPPSPPSLRSAGCRVRSPRAPRPPGQPWSSPSTDFL